MSTNLQAVKLGSKSKWLSTDAWRGYLIPPYAVAGVSYTGEYPDSPCPYSEVRPELDKLRAYLQENGITSTKIVRTPSSNVFMVKLWVTAPDEYEKALELTNEWLAKNDDDTQYIHSASGGEELEEEPEEGEIVELEEEKPKLSANIMVQKPHVEVDTLKNSIGMLQQAKSNTEIKDALGKLNEIAPLAKRKKRAKRLHV
jgi:hypothetical protein